MTGQGLGSDLWIGVTISHKGKTLLHGKNLYLYSVQLSKELDGLPVKVWLN